MRGMGRDLVLYQFSRGQVERGDFGHFLSLCALDNLPTGRRLREMMNRCVVRIDGWGGSAGAILLVPEIRRFYSRLHDAWPYWLYFCNLDADALGAITMCSLPSIETMQVDGQARVAVAWNRLDLLKLLQRDFVSMGLMCERAEMSEERIYDRRKAVLEYFGLASNVEAAKRAPRMLMSASPKTRKAINRAPPQEG